MTTEWFRGIMPRRPDAAWYLVPMAKLASDTGSSHGETRLRCPKDAALMEKIKVGRLIIDHCARCGAMWFDAYELAETIKQGMTGDVDYGTADQGRAGFGYQQQAFMASPRMCPRCQIPLTTVPDPQQPHVMVDICTQCRGVLLDEGELKDLSELTLMERLKAFLKRA